LINIGFEDKFYFKSQVLISEILMSRNKSYAWKKRVLRKSARKFKIDFEKSKEIWNKELEKKRQEKLNKKEANPYNARIPKKSERSGTQVQVTVRKPRKYPWKPEVFVQSKNAVTLSFT